MDVIQVYCIVEFCIQLAALTKVLHIESMNAMNVAERIFEHRIWQQIDIDDMQFGFVKGKGITDAIFIVRQMQEKERSSILALWIWRKLADDLVVIAETEDDLIKMK